MIKLRPNFSDWRIRANLHSVIQNGLGSSLCAFGLNSPVKMCKGYGTYDAIFYIQVSDLLKDVIPLSVRVELEDIFADSKDSKIVLAEIFSFCNFGERVNDFRSDLVEEYIDSILDENKGHILAEVARLCCWTKRKISTTKMT